MVPLTYPISHPPSPDVVMACWFPFWTQELCSSSQLCFSRSLCVEWYTLQHPCLAGHAKSCAPTSTEISCSVCWSVCSCICHCRSWSSPVFQSFASVTLAVWPCKYTHLTLKVFLSHLLVSLLWATCFKRQFFTGSLHFLCFSSCS